MSGGTAPTSDSDLLQYGAVPTSTRVITVSASMVEKAVSGIDRFGLGGDRFRPHSDRFTNTLLGVIPQGAIPGTRKLWPFSLRALRAGRRTRHGHGKTACGQSFRRRNHIWRHSMIRRSFEKLRGPALGVAHGLGLDVPLGHVGEARQTNPPREPQVGNSSVETWAPQFPRPGATKVFVNERV